jgi:hypothetical protein
MCAVLRDFLNGSTDRKTVRIAIFLQPLRRVSQLIQMLERTGDTPFRKWLAGKTSDVLYKYVCACSVLGGSSQPFRLGSELFSRA